MAGSRANWENQTGESDMSGSSLTKEERKENKNNKDRMIDSVPGDKGSTVDKIRKAKLKQEEAMEGE